MNILTALFCIAPPLVVGVIVIAYITQTLNAAALKNAKTTLAEQARERALAIREAKAERDALLHEAKIAAEHNKVVLQDLKLESEKLKIKELEYKTRHMNPRLNFEATDYQDPPAS